MKTNCLNCGRRCTTYLILRNKGNCPFFCGRITVETVAKIVGKSWRTVIRWDAEKVEKSARERGYIVIVEEDGERHKYYGGKIKCNHLNNAQ